MTKLTLSDVSNILGNPTSAANTINANNQIIEDAFEQILSRDGESPNQMTSDIDLNNNDVLNAGVLNAASLVLNGAAVTPDELATIPSTVMLKATYDPQGKNTDAFAQPITNISSTTQQIRDYIDLSGKFESDKPYVSLKDNLKAHGLRPEWFDTTNEIATAGDACIPLRAMFAWGIANGVNKYVLTPGTTYHMRSPDPLGTGQQTNSIGVVLYSLTADITFDMTGAVVKGYDTIRTNPDNPGAMFWFQSANTSAVTSEDQRLHIIRGKIDATSLTPSTPGMTTIGGMSFVGRFNVFLDHVIADAGTTTPSGDAIGVGGGDQAFFFSNTAYVHALNCIVMGWPDLAYYFSNSGIKGALIQGGLIADCQNGIGVKRFSSLVRVEGVHIRRCDIGVYNPVSDGLVDNMGGRMIVDGCLFERIQSRPIDVNALADGSVVQNNRIYDWGRRISDGAENTLVERLAAVRIRSKLCQVQNNHFELRDWTLTTTSGKEQVGLIFSVNGAVAGGIAEDGSHTGNYYEGLFQKVRYDATTLRNIGRNERGVNITSSDTDSGDNIFWIRLLDDTFATYVPDSNRSVLMIEALTTSAGSPNIMVHCNTTGAPATVNYPSGMATPASIILTTAITTVAGAADTNFTVSSVSDGKVYLINRTGGTLVLRVTEVSR